MNAPLRHLVLTLCLAAASCSRGEMAPPMTEEPAATSATSGAAGGRTKTTIVNDPAPRDLPVDGTVTGAAIDEKPAAQPTGGQPIGGTAGSYDGEARGPTDGGNLGYAERVQPERPPTVAPREPLVRKEAVFQALEQKPADPEPYGRLLGRGQGGEDNNGFDGDGDGLVDGKLTGKAPPPPDHGVASPKSGLKDSLEAALGEGWHEGASDLGKRAGDIDDLQTRDAVPKAEVVANELSKVDPATLATRPDEDEVSTTRHNIKGDEKGKDVTDREADLRGLARGTYTLRVTGEDPALFVPPPTTLPRMFYFENTYLGGSAAYAERLRRLDAALGVEPRPYELVRAEAQPFDAPRTEGLAVSASVDASHFERARRVFLQIGLQGSSRYGWRRPPLDVVLVLDRPALDRGLDAITDFVVELLRTLGPSDRIGLVVAGSPAPFLEVTRLTTAQQHLAHRIDALEAPATNTSTDLADAMRRAGVMLNAASDDEATVPGTKTVLVLTGGPVDPTRIRTATAAAHELTVQGAVTSVFALGAEAGEWWQVANAGYGNLHHLGEPTDLGTRTRSFSGAIGEELSSIARVVARLVRVNVRLGKDTKAIRVLGTRVLEQREVEDVKARELATDRNLSKSLGIVSDRGEDDDGIQTVIPYFYGDDSHVILVELWVEGPGVVADVTVRYKDMVNLDNATARTSVRLGTRPQPPTREQLLVARNARGFELAENLQAASDAVYRNDYGGAWQNLGAAAAAAAETNAEDARAVTTLKSLIEQRDWQGDAARRATLTETLLISGQRRVGDTGTAARKR